MMKKILSLAIAIILMFTYTGCSNEGNKEITDDRFEYIEIGWIDGIYTMMIVDKETKVIYLRSDGITVMLDADGKPLLWEE